ncbi:MAG TPA: S1C family serine protease [Acidimicrobiales bacterium]|nr:S1C family serine protease [Acidimicrobiales bacterium]
MDTSPGVPDPLEGGDAPRGEDETSGADWLLEEEGPFFAWLPPEDRLWRHPSEAAPMREGTTAGPGASGARASGGRASGGRVSGAGAGRDSEGRWSGLLPLSVVRSTWAVALIAGLVGAGAATGVGLATGLWPQKTTVVRSVVPSTSAVSLADIGPEPTNWTAIDDSVAPSVVTVSVDGAAGPQTGSGLVILQSAGGNAFVVTDRSLFARGQAAGYIGTVEVTFLSGAKSRAKVIGQDRLSGLAVLQIADAGHAVPAQLGTVAQLREADPVLAVGSRTAPSVSPGLVSAEDRTISLADGTDIDGLLAVSMSALSGTASGGPLLNQFGQVVGVTVGLDAVDSAEQQFTYAVPIDEVSRVATEMIDGSPPTHPWLGIADAEDVPSTMAHQLGVDGGVQAGTVSPQSPAGQAGMRSADVITSLDGRPVASAGALLAQVNSCIPGRSMPVTYVHQGRTVHATVRVAEEPADS